MKMAGKCSDSKASFFLKQEWVPGGIPGRSDGGLRDKLPQCWLASEPDLSLLFSSCSPSRALLGEKRKEVGVGKNNASRVQKVEWGMESPGQPCEHHWFI